MTRFPFAAFFVFCTALVGGNAFAQHQDGDSEILMEIERRLKDRADEEQRLRREAAAKSREVASLRNRLIETANTIQEAEAEIIALEASIEKLGAERAGAVADLDAESNTLSDLLAALQSLERSQPPALLVSPEDANKAARTAMLLATAAPEVEARAQEVRESIELLNSLTAELSAEQTRYSDQKLELTARRTVLLELVEAKEGERDVAERLAAAAQKETARLAARATTLRDVVRRLEKLAYTVVPRIKPPRGDSSDRTLTANIAEAPRKSVRPETAAPFATAKRFADARGALRPPVTGRLTGQYRASRPDGGRFEGLRFAVSDEAIVTAPFEGRVVFARDWQPVGNLIVLDVGGGFHVLLMGVGSILVEESQRVAAGEPVAQMIGGGAELDLEIRKNGEPMNPSLWLSRKSIDEMAY
ncbi:MAG: peptidoglycan DD-metalloendopeptidase family protein [Pseudomonadota bacterium]